jgi:hypothetical protein
MAANHNFIVETTAPDASSENGLGERPHCTLKEKVRCLLYTVGLGVEFWSNALLNAVWLYNRTYHSSIERTPYEVWTSHKPCLDRLVTFRSKITVRKAKNWTTPFLASSWVIVPPWTISFTGTTNLNVAAPLNTLQWLKYNTATHHKHAAPHPGTSSRYSLVPHTVKDEQIYF